MSVTDLPAFWFDHIYPINHLIENRKSRAGYISGDTVLVCEQASDAMK